MQPTVFLLLLYDMYYHTCMTCMLASDLKVTSIQGWPVAFTGGICHRYLPVNTDMDNTPKIGVYRYLLAFINIH